MKYNIYYTFENGERIQIGTAWRFWHDGEYFYAVKLIGYFTKAMHTAEFNEYMRASGLYFERVATCS